MPAFRFLRIVGFTGTTENSGGYAGSRGSVGDDDLCQFGSDVITPGEQQARNALLEARRQLLSGADHATVLEKAKVFASFSGAMRTNLIAMLDHIGLHRWAGLASVADLWTSRSDLAHFTSALRYPVFVNGKNYSGQPSMTATPALRKLLASCLNEEAVALPDAVWIPLGPTATAGVEWVVQLALAHHHHAHRNDSLRTPKKEQKLTSLLCSVLTF